MRKFLLQASLIRNYEWKSYQNYDEDIECCICCCTLIDEPVFETNCGHKYHKDCIITNIYDYKRKTCPKCNKEFEYKPTKKDLINQIVIPKTDSIKNEPNHESEKQLALIKTHDYSFNINSFAL